VALVCDGLLLESSDDIDRCELGEACQALALRGDHNAYRAAHSRLIEHGQAENNTEYGGEA
jgi:hypothetical protein